MPADVRQLLEETGALLTGHFRLSTGLHSPNYVQCALLLQVPRTNDKKELAAEQMFASLHGLLMFPSPKRFQAPPLSRDSLPRLDAILISHDHYDHLEMESMRHFAGRGRVFMVHFRNIRGGFGDFVETYPEDGDVDMLAAARAYRESGYRGMLCPDHVPHSDVDPGGERQFAFCLGYIRAAIQAAG